MAWTLQGEIGALGRVRDRGTTSEEQDFPAALRQEIAQRFQVAQIGSRTLTWEERRYVSGQRAAKFRATFSGDITRQEFMAFIRTLFSDDPVRGWAEIRESESEKPWYRARIVANGASWEEYPKPESILRAQESRAGW